MLVSIMVFLLTAGEPTGALTATSWCHATRTTNAASLTMPHTRLCNGKNQEPDAILCYPSVQNNTYSQMPESVRLRLSVLMLTSYSAFIVDFLIQFALLHTMYHATFLFISYTMLCFYWLWSYICCSYALMVVLSLYQYFLIVKSIYRNKIAYVILSVHPLLCSIAERN